MLFWVQMVVAAWIVQAFVPGVCGVRIDQRGNNFIVAFPDSGTNDNVNLLVITSETDVKVYVMMDGENDTEHFLSAGSSRHIYFPYQTTVFSNMVVERKAIHIVASDKVSVYGYVNQYNAMDGFLALPVKTLSNEYIAVTYYSHAGAGGHVIIAATENDTIVNVTLSTTANCNSTRMMQGDILAFRLQMRDVVRVYCDRDITGTLIKANKPVAVLSGNPLTQVPKKVDFPDNLVEMLIPTYAFGRKYALGPIAGRQCGVVYRIVAEQHGTEVFESDGTRHVLSARTFKDLDFTQADYRCITSSKPVMVVQFAKGQAADGSALEGDPFMAIMPPVERYTSSYVLDLITSSSTPGYILVPYVSVFVAKNDSSGLEFIPQSSSFRDIPGCDITTASISAGQGELTLSHRDGSVFGATVHGLITFKAYGYLAGIALDNFSGRADCDGSPCKHSGVCYESGDSYRCYCPAGFRGRLCENDEVNDCLGEPCRNGGTCQDLVGNYTCICPPRFTGERCFTGVTTDSPALSVDTTSSVIDDVTTDRQMHVTREDLTTTVHEVPVKVKVTSNSNACQCTCKNITIEEVEEKAKEIRKQLAVDPIMLSKSKRKFVSIQDTRMSAAGIGYIGGAFLTLVFGSIFLVDLSTFLSRWLASVKHKTRHHQTAERETSISRKHILHVRPEAIVIHLNKNEQ
ncbi:uncharacterized protein [Haliotis asinina]|uniref:uncharacterized protein n=1 Tax=Haliotis asinina TaxID=109174 RepID=UPI00353256B5